VAEIPGQSPFTQDISFQDLRQAYLDAQRSRMLSAGPGFEALSCVGGLHLRDSNTRGIWARITAQNPGDQRQYSWEQVLPDDSWVLGPFDGAPAGDYDTMPAVELLGNTTVPADPETGAVVRLDLAATGDHWEFVYYASGEVLSPVYGIEQTVEFAAGAIALFDQFSFLTLDGPDVEVTRNTTVTVDAGKALSFSGAGAINFYCPVNFASGLSYTFNGYALFAYALGWQYVYVSLAADAHDLVRPGYEPLLAVTTNADGWKLGGITPADPTQPELVGISVEGNHNLILQHHDPGSVYPITLPGSVNLTLPAACGVILSWDPAAFSWYPLTVDSVGGSYTPHGAYQIPYANSAGTALTDSSDLKYDSSAMTLEVGVNIGGRVAIGSNDYGLASGSAIALADVVAAPSANPTGGLIAYSAAGVFTVLQPDGTVAALQPTPSGGAGRIPFESGAGKLTDDPQLYWDNSNKALVLLGPGARLDLGDLGTGSGTGAMISLDDAGAVPTTNPATGGILYADGGDGHKLKWRTSAGTVYVLGDFSGTVGVTQGGTGLTSCAAGDLLYGSAANTISTLAGNTSTTRKFLRETGTGAAAQAPAWDTLQAGDYPAFVQAGGSHAQGAVPDPGATAHSHQQYMLRDSAAWEAVKGQPLGFTAIPTDESTSSTTYVSLTTPDSVTFTLDASGDVLVRYDAYQYSNTAGWDGYSIVYLDGVQQSATETSARTIGATANQSVVLIARLTGLSAGSHTIEIKHHTSSGQTMHWDLRYLSVYLG
jgi:hypothetical protein